MKINSSLSHRRNLESVLETKVTIPEKNSEHKPFTVSSPQSGISFRENGKNYSRKTSVEYKVFTVSSPQSGIQFRDKGKIIPEKRAMNTNSSPYLIAAIWNPV